MRRGVVIVAVVLALVLGWAGYASTQPPDRHDYRIAAVEAAQSAHDALQTAYLAGVALRDGKVNVLYVAVLLDGGTRRTTTLVQQLGELSPPDAGMRDLREELDPLLTESVERLGDAASEPTAVDGLPPVIAKLDDVLDRYA